MSTEPPVPAAAATSRGFRARLVTIIAVLAVAAAGLAAAGVAQGPRLGSATINPAAAVVRPGQQLVLEANQPLAGIDASAVRVAPQAPVEVAADGNRIVVRFTGLLRYATDYTVEVETRSLATGVAATLDYAFTTPDIDVYSLERNPDGDDRILRHRLSEPVSNEPVFQAPRIQEYAPVGDLLAVVVLDAEGAPEVRFADPAGGLSGAVALPPGVRAIRELRALGAPGMFGFIVDRRDGEATSTLYVHDLADGSGAPLAIEGPGGTPLTAMDWTPVPGRSSLVVQGQDQQLYLVDPVAGTPPAPLGEHWELRGFLPGTTTLVVADPDAGSLLDLASGERETLRLPPADTAPGFYPGAFVLTSPGSYVELYTDPLGASDRPFRSVLYAVDADGTRELFHLATATSRIGAVCLSPNGQYLAVEAIPGDAEPDRYPIVGGWTGTTVYFVDAETGETRRGVDGMRPDWCA